MGTPRSVVDPAAAFNRLRGRSAIAPHEKLAPENFLSGDGQTLLRNFLMVEG
jgi:hypothetical protein